MQVRQHLTEQLYLVLLPLSMEEESQDAGDEEVGPSAESVDEALALISEADWVKQGEDEVQQSLERLRALLLSKGC